MAFDPALIEALRHADHVAVFTGAGVSAESGVPTFREAQTGLWARFRAEDLATPEAFMRDPATVWNWYQWRRELIGAAVPNPAHYAIARLQDLVRRVTVITQNVDGLHRRAGSREVLELHGNIWDNRCFACGRAVSSPVHSGAVPPHCAYCDGMLRPGVVWFGEALPQAVWEQALALAQSASVFLCVGTSSLVEPAASLPRLAFGSGRRVVQINPEPTAHDAVAQHVLRGKAGAVLPALLGAAGPPGASMK